MTESWHGALPEGWRSAPLYATYDVQLGKMLNPNAVVGDHLAPYLRNTDVQWGHVRTDELPLMNFPPEDVDRYALKHGDILVCEGGDIGRCAVWEAPIAPCFYQKALHRLRPRRDGQLGRFMYYAIYAAAHRGAFEEGASKSTISHLTVEKLRRHRFPVPPLDVQRAIADFLDRKTAALDALIDKKERLLALLQEKRQALITQAVTKGLDPNVPRQDSGIEWLGEIPAHWEVVKFGRLISDGPRNGVSPPVSSEGGVRSFSISVIRSGRVELRDEDIKFVELPPADARRYALRLGDILLIRGNGNPSLVGRTGIVDQDLSEYVYPDILMRIRCIEGVDPWFINEVLNGAYARVQTELVTRTTVGTYKINNQQVRELLIALPPTAEQSAIVEHLHRSSERARALSDAIVVQLKRLREYRQALITAAVTGQLEVA